MKKIILSALLALALTGCATMGDDTNPETGVTDLNPDCGNCTDEITTVTARLPHGGTVDCLLLYGGSYGAPAMSCDWDHAKRGKQ